MRDSSLIRSATQIWNQISEVNNLEFEFHLIEDKVPVLIANDVYKNPDLVSEFFENLDYWETRYFVDSDNVRPGLTHRFPNVLRPTIASQLEQRIKTLFGVSKLSVWDLYLQCTCGNMTLDSTGSLCCYPHVDTPLFDTIDEIPCFVANINLSKSVHPVTTGFWSWRGKTNALDFDRNDKNSLSNFYSRHELQKVNSWFQIRNYEDFVFETSVTMRYNSLVVYPTMNIHNPYIEPHWFTDKERLMLSVFFCLSPEDLDFEDRHLDTVSYSWEHFRLDTLFNYHPQQTQFE